ncbi:minor capsid protein [Streptococcus suis]|uniref:minor capsid protein n=1 Tax=Streptococcus suis TaxID=1307 RepID=UPI00345B6CC0
MTESHNDYWQKRVDDIFKHQDMTDEVFFKELSRIYSEASTSLQKDLFEFYGKYAEDSKISLSEARERLSRVDLSDYRANVERYRKQAEKDPELLRRINKQYMSSRATRMDVLNMEVVYKMGVLKGVLEKSFEDYLRSSAEYAYRKAMGGRSGNINEPALKEIIKTPFNGYNYSQQLWGHVDNLARDLKDTLKRGFIRGEHPKILARDLSVRYKVANQRAETLIRTDGTSVINRATARRYMDASLEFYRILVHMDNRTTEICRKHHAEDKRYRLDEMKVGVNAPPFHFNCRSGIMPDEEELGGENGGFLLQEEDIKISKKDSDNAYSVNRELVNSKAYHDKFEKLPFSKSSREALYSNGKRILEHRDGTFGEDLVVLDFRTGKVLTENVTATEGGKVALNREQYQRVLDAPHGVILLHNHPEGRRLSKSDVFSVFKESSVKASVVVGHDGEVYYIYDINRIISLDLEFEKIYNKYKELGLPDVVANSRAMDEIYSLGAFKHGHE